MGIFLDKNINYRYNKIISILIGSLTCVTVIYSILNYQNQLDRNKEVEAERLSSILKTLITEINIKDIREPFERSNKETGNILNSQHFMYYMKLFKKVKEINNIKGEILTVKINSDNNSFQEGYRSTYANQFFNDEFNALISKNYLTGGYSISNKYDKGLWITVFYPIKINNIVIGSILVNDSLSESIWHVQKNAILDITVFLIITILIGYLLSSLLKVFLNNEYNREQSIINSKQQIENERDEVLNSIKYAKNIQNAVLPNIKNLKENFNDAFVLYKPKDIVSGDFYWYGRKNHLEYVIAADCTGHGVPGGFMSMIGNAIIGECVFELNITNSHELLNNMESLLTKRFESDLTVNREGMDLAVCIINQQDKTIDYSGAHRPLYFITKEKFAEYKPDRTSIGGAKPSYFEGYKQNLIRYNKGDRFYIGSDGFSDQFGKEGKKITTKGLKKFLFDIQNHSLTAQKKLLDEYLIAWQNNTAQIDDILLIGIEL